MGVSTTPKRRVALGIGTVFAALALVVGLASPGLAGNIYETEPNDFRQDSGVLTFIPGIDGLYGDLHGFSANDDYWEFTANAGSQYTFVANAINCSGFTDPMDIGIEIRNASGGVVAYSDFGFSCQNETIVWTPSSSGTYYVVLYEATGTPTFITTYRVDIFVSGPSPSPTNTPTPTASPTPTPIYTQETISIKAKALTYDQSSGRIYASIPSSEGRFGNTIAVIDPSKAAIQGYVFAGSEPGRMTVTAGGEYLYTILDGGGAVRPINLSNMQRLPQFTLGIEASTYRYPRSGADITYLLGSPQSVVVSNVGPIPLELYGARIYDNGVPRPDAGPPAALYIEPSGSSGSIYAATEPVSNFDFYELTVGVSGLSVANNATLSGGSGSNADMEYANGRIYTTTGREVNPATMSVVGTFSGGVIEPDAPNNRLFVLTTSGNLNILNLATRASLRTISLGSGTRSNLIRWGNNGLAFITNGTTINLLRITDSALLPQTAAPTPAPLSGVPPVPYLPTFQIEQTLEVPVTANDLVYDKTRHLLYVSVPNGVPTIGGTITQIDPDTGALGASVSVGSQPTKLELTRNDEFLYVGLNGENRVRLVDLATFTAGTSFTLGSSVAFDLAVDPLTTTTLAVSEDSGTTPLLTIYDNGVPRLNSAPLSMTSKVEYKADGTAVYAYGGLTYASISRKFAVTPSGIPNPSQFEEVVGLLMGVDAQLENGIMYSSGGAFADLETPQRLGWFAKADYPIAAYSSYGPPAQATSASRGISYFAYRTIEVPLVVGKLLLYNHTRYLNIADFTVGQIDTAPQSMVTCGTDGVAVRTLDKIVIINLQFINATEDWEKYD